MKVKVTEYNIRNVVILWRIATSVKVIWCIFAIALTIPMILTVQIWPWIFRSRHENNIRNDPIEWQITSIIVILELFSLTLTVFEIFTFQILWPSKCGPRSWRRTFAVTPFDSKYLTFYLNNVYILSTFTCQNSHLKNLIFQI